MMWDHNFISDSHLTGSVVLNYFGKQIEFEQTFTVFFIVLGKEAHVTVTEDNYGH